MTQRPTSDSTALSDAELDALFEAADQEVPLPSAALFERILDDAARERDMFLAHAPVPASSPLTRLRQTLGGWTGLSGLAGAMALGLVVGLFPPDALSSYAGALTDAAFLSDYVPGTALGLEEFGIDG